MVPAIYLHTVAVSASADDTQAEVEVEANGDGVDEVVLLIPPMPPRLLKTTPMK